MFILFVLDIFPHHKGKLKSYITKYLTTKEFHQRWNASCFC